MSAADASEQPEVVYEKSPSLSVARMRTAGADRVRSAVAAFDAGAGEVIGGIGDRKVLKIPLGNPLGDCVLKVRSLASVKKKVESAFKGSPGARAFKAGVKLRAAGVPVAEPIACVEDKTRSVLIVRFVSGRTLQAALDAMTKAKDAYAIETVCGRAARAVARLHAAGATHGDLKPPNVIVPQKLEADLVLVDLERVRWDAKKNPSRVARDLAALDAYGQRLAHPLGIRTRKHAFDAYLEARAQRGDPVAAEAVPALLKMIIAESRSKRARWRTAEKKHKK